MRVRPLPPPREFYRNLARGLGASAVIIALSLGVGIVGYHAIAGLGWVDSLLNAAMLLAGEGPVAGMTTTGAKVFASAYALFSGVVFISVAGLLVARVAHRLLHRFHLEQTLGDDAPAPPAATVARSRRD